MYSLSCPNIGHDVTNFTLDGRYRDKKILNIWRTEEKFSKNKKHFSVVCQRVNFLKLHFLGVTFK